MDADVAPWLRVTSELQRHIDDEYYMIRVNMRKAVTTSSEFVLSILTRNYVNLCYLNCWKILDISFNCADRRVVIFRRK
jgi:hypothetical protein